MFASKGEPTPCAGCVNEPPATGPETALFDELYGAAFGARDGDGGFRYDVLRMLMDLEGISGTEQAEVIRAAIAVETKVAEARSRKLDKELADSKRKQKGGAKR